MSNQEYAPDGKGDGNQANHRSGFGGQVSATAASMKQASPSQLAAGRVGSDPITRNSAQCDDCHDDSPNVVSDDVEEDLQDGSEKQFANDASWHDLTSVYQLNFCFRGRRRLRIERHSPIPSNSSLPNSAVPNPEKNRMNP